MVHTDIERMGTFLEKKRIAPLIKTIRIWFIREHTVHSAGSMLEHAFLTRM